MQTTGQTTRPTRLIVQGHDGLLEGVRRRLRPGHTLVVGRSRSCDVSLRRTPRFVKHPNEVDVFESPGFRRVSRIHCEIAYLPDGRVEVRDLSQNGTLVDGRPVERSCFVDPSGGAVRLELADGAHGYLILRLDGPPVTEAVIPDRRSEARPR